MACKVRSGKVKLAKINLQGRGGEKRDERIRIRRGEKRGYP